MATFTLDTRQWEAWRDAFDRLMGPGQAQVLRAGADAAGVALDGFVRSTLPPVRQSRTPSPLRTPRQRRWWWATLNAKARGDPNARLALPGWKAVYKRIDGKKRLVISGGYRRTGKLMQSMTWDVVARGDGVEVHYGTNRSYAPYVVGLPDDPDVHLRQAQIHQGNWTPLASIAAAHLDSITEAFQAAAVRETARQLGAGG